MIVKILFSSAAIFCLLMGWLVVQSLSRIFAKNHPEFGPAREEGQGCGNQCNCLDKEACSNKNM
jgi:hypothetical protein